MEILNRVYKILRARSRRDGTHFGSDEFNTGQSSFNTFSEENEASNKMQQDPHLARCYANLELSYGADLATVKRAWKRLLKKYHPDLHTQDKEKNQTANQLTAELTKAYQELEKALSKKERN